MTRDERRINFWGIWLAIMAGLCLAHCAPLEAEQDELETVESSTQSLGRVRCNNGYDCRDVGGETVGLKVRAGLWLGGAKVKVFERPRRRDDVKVELDTYFFKDGACVCRISQETSGKKTTRALITGAYKVIVGVEGECDADFDCEVTGPTGSVSAKRFPFDGVYAVASIRNDGERERIEGWEGNVHVGSLCYEPCN